MLRHPFTSSSWSGQPPTLAGCLTASLSAEALRKLARLSEDELRSGGLHGSCVTRLAPSAVHPPLVGGRAEHHRASAELHGGVERDYADRRVGGERQHRLGRPTVVGQGSEMACTVADIADPGIQAGGVAADVVALVIPAPLGSFVARAAEDVCGRPDEVEVVDGPAAVLGGVG